MELLDLVPLCEKIFSFTLCDIRAS